MSSIYRLRNNLKSSVYFRVLSILGSLILTPVILKYVDLNLYGLNALLISFVGYFNILNLGLNSGISRYTAIFFGKEEYGKIYSILYFSLKYFFLISLFILVLLFVLSLFIQNITVISDNLLNSARILILIYAISSFFLWSLIPFRAIINGVQRVDIINKVGSLIIIINFILVLIVYRYTKSYILYIGLFQTLTVILSFIYIVFVRKKIFRHKLKYTSLEKDLKYNLLKFSGLSFLGSIFGLLIFQVDYLVIGTFCGVGAIAIYTIAFNIQTQIRSLNSLLGSPIYYIITAEFVKRDAKEQNDLILKVAKLHTCLLVPIVIITLIFAEKFIVTWVGMKFVNAVMPCRVLLTFWLFNLTTETLTQGIVGGRGKVAETTKINGFVAVSNLVLSLILVQYIGITGVALGTTIPYIIAFFYYIYYFCKILSLPLKNFIKSVIILNIPHYTLAVVLSFLVLYIFRTVQINVYMVITLMISIYLCSISFAFILLNSAEKNLLKKTIFYKKNNN